MYECYNKCINIAVVSYYYHYYYLIKFIWQKNIKLTILSFMNVDGAFILAETIRKTSVQIYKWFSLRIWENFVSRITLSHPSIVKMYTNITEHLTCNTVSAQIFLMLWTLKPWQPRASCSTVWIHAICACLRKHNNVCYLFTNWLRQFRYFNHHTVTSNNHPFLFSSKTCDAVLNSLWLSVLIMIFVSFSDTFKCFHTADMFAVLVRAYLIMSLYCLVQFIRSFRLFCYFGNFSCRTWHETF